MKLKKMKSVTISKTSLFLNKDKFDPNSKSVIEKKVEEKFNELRDLKHKRKNIEKENIKLKNRILLFENNDQKMQEKITYIHKLIQGLQKKKKNIYLKKRISQKKKNQEKKNRLKQHKKIILYKKERKFLKEKYLSQKLLKNREINKEGRNIRKLAKVSKNKIYKNMKKRAETLKKTKSLGKFLINQFHIHKKKQIFFRINNIKNKEKLRIQKNMKLFKKYKKYENDKLKNLQIKKQNQDNILKKFQNLISISN